MAKSAWGIELGTSSVKAVRLSGDSGGGVSLESFAIVSLSDYGLGGGVSREDALAGALSALRVSEGIRKGEQVFVSLTGQNTLGRIISLPPVPKERVRETIQNEARSQIPIKLEEAVWDYQVIEESEGEDELKVNLYAAKKEVVQQLLECCDSAGLQVTGVQVAPLGIYNYIKYEFDDSVAESCVAIDIGADNTDVVIIDGQKTYVRVVPVAGNEVTKALRARFKLSAPDAEKLKKNAAKSKDAAAVFEAMKPPLKDMVGEIYRAVGFYKNQNETANIAKLVMMGNGSKLLNIKKFFEQQLQYEVHKVEAPQRLTLSRNVDPAEVNETIQSLTVAVGLGLQGLGVDGVNTINLLPPEYVQGKASAKLRTPFYVAGGLAAAGGVLALLVSVFTSGAADGAVGDAKGAAEAAKAAHNEYNSSFDISADRDKTLSLQNLSAGVIGTVETSPAEEGVEAVTQPVTISVHVMPGLIMNSVDRALAETLMGGARPVYRANGFGAPGTRGSQLQGSINSNYMLEYTPINMTSERTYWSASRTISYEVALATRLDLAEGNEAANAAHEELKTKLAPDAGGGAVRTRLLEALKKQLVESGAVSQADIGKVKFDDVRVEVLKPMGATGPVEVTGLFSRSEAANMRYRRGGGTDQVGTVPKYPYKFVISRVLVTIKLNPVTPPAQPGA